MFAATGSTMIAAIVAACRSNAAPDGVEVVIWDDERLGCDVAWDAGAGGERKRCQTGAGSGQQTVGVTVVTALEFQDQIATRRGAGDA